MTVYQKQAIINFLSTLLQFFLIRARNLFLIRAGKQSLECISYHCTNFGTHGLHFIEEEEKPSSNERNLNFSESYSLAYLCYIPDLMVNHVFVTVRQQTQFEKIRIYLFSAIRGHENIMSVITSYLPNKVELLKI